MLQPRRNHIALVIGTDLFIHGGVDENGNYQDSIFAFCLRNYTNNTFKYEVSTMRTGYNVSDKGPGKISHHTACLVPVKNTTQSKQNFTQGKDIKKVKPDQPKYEGIYMFGGKNEHGEAQGKLFLLNYAKRP